MNGFTQQFIDIITDPNKTPLDVYKELHVMHNTAKLQNEPVIYPDTDPRPGHTDKVLEITIFGDVLPNDPDYANNWKRKPIPLSYYTDFNGWTFHVNKRNPLYSTS